MTDLFGTEKMGDKELQEFLLIEKQKAQFNAQVCSLMTFLKFIYDYYIHVIRVSKPYKTEDEEYPLGMPQNHCS